MVSFLRKHLATVVVATLAGMVAAGSMAVAHDADGGGHDSFAHNADKVDKHHANAISRVAFDRVQNNALVGPATGAVLSTTITAPKKGFLEIVASSDVFGSSGFVHCWIEIGGAELFSTERSMELDGATNGEEDCSTNGLQPVAKGTYVVELIGDVPNGIRFDEAAMSVQFIPFNAIGKKPTNFTIVAPLRDTEQGNR